MQARLDEAFDRLAEGGANIRKNDKKYVPLELRIKAAGKRFQRILVEARNKLQLQHQKLESEMLGQQTAQIVALNAEHVAIVQETEVRIQTLEEENVRHGNDNEAKITALKAVHAEILQQATATFMDQLKQLRRSKWN